MILPSTSRPSSGGSTDDRVLASFQETMRAFLEVQRTTMLAYLNNRPAGGSSSASAAPPSSVPNNSPSPLVDQPPARRESRLEAVGGQSVAPSNGVAPRPTSRPETVAELPKTDEPMGRERIASRLVEIVRDRTGYPSEMLGLDLDLEADLGIDSIKRVEILGTLRDSVPAIGGSADSSIMDSLSRARTLGSIVDRVVEISSHEPSAAAAIPPAISRSIPDPVVPPPSASLNPVRRMLIEAVPAPLPRTREGLEPGGLVLVTDDGRGVARAVGTRLEASGYSVILAGPGEVDFSSPSSVDGLLDLARSSGEIAAIVHALPLRDARPAGLDRGIWASRIGPEVKGLFLLAKGAADDLERASRRGGGALIAATAMGGAFATGTDTIDFFPGHGGVAGLVKTLAREWSGVRARVVDFNPDVAPASIGSRLVDEVLSDDGWSEVGYSGESRVRLQPRIAPLVAGAGSGLELRPGEPVVITGGARGITATVAAELARRWKPTLLLVGRSPLPEGAEERETASITSPGELKAALHAQFRREGRTVSPAGLEQSYQAILQAREIRANLALLREAGATVEYVSVDVRDASAIGPVLSGWRRKFGDPVGFIHGAGVIKDKLIRDKTAGSFDQVLGTKLDGALNLARMLKPESIRFAALFSSIAGRFGNLGQADYAAANDVLNKLALWLDRRWPGRVVSMNWGPWSGVGMVSELEGHLGGRGLGMIPPEIGKSLLYDELRLGRKGDVEVIAAGDLGTLDRPIDRAIPAEATR